MTLLKKIISPILLPWFTLFAGALGLILNIWLFSDIDAKGLLPAAHPAEKLLYLLIAFVFIVLIVCVRDLKDKKPYRDLYPADFLRAIGCLIGGVGIALSAISWGVATNLEMLALLLGLCAAGALVYIAFLRLKGTQPSYLLYLAVLAYLVLDIVCRSRSWSIIPQMHTYLFPLLAGIFLMFNTYHLALVSCDRCSHRACVFFNQMSLFLCCVCMSGENAFFYIAMTAWLLLDLCMLSNEAPAQTTEEA